MKIKISKNKNPIIEYATGFLSRYLNTQKRQLAVVLIIVYSLLLFLAGILVHKTDVIEEKLKPAMKKKRVFLKHLAKGVLAKPEHITIDIAHKDFQKLEYKRQQALEMNKLITEADDFVPAKIRYRGKGVRVKLRLKGDHTDHLQGNKWSFRMKVKGNDTLFGMKQFSIQHPKTRNYIYEWLYHEVLKREGLAFLRYDFIDVTLNGKDLGIYALEEFFEKQLIENSRYREGPIVRFDESAMWDELMQRGEIVNSGTYLSSSIDAFQTGGTLDDSAKREQFIKAISLLESFRRGELKASDVFDTKKLATFLAVSDLMGAQHAAIWINMRFYLNPITARLEPVGFDGNSGIPIDSLILKSDDIYTPGQKQGVLGSFYTALSSDPVFFSQYIKELERVSAPDYLERFFNEIEGELENKLNILYKEFPYYNFSKDVFDHNRHIINVTLDPVKALNAYFKSAHNDSVELELGNIQSMDAEVLSVSYKDSIVLKPLKSMILPGKSASLPVEYKDVKFFFPEGFNWEGGADIPYLKLNCRIFGTERERTEGVLPYIHLSKAYIDNDLLRQKSNTEDFKFIVVDNDAGKIIILPGEWVLTENLIFPRGFTVMASEGTTISLSNKANIVSYSPVQFIGTKERPFMIYSEDSTSQGVIIMADGAGSVLNNVVFKNLAAPKGLGWELTGAVTFYESPVDIYYCRFTGNRDSDDGLNIVRSEFIIDNTLFDHTFSDAFDCDFGKGRISDSSFIQCGNDGIDVSGTVVDIEKVIVDEAGDKGISVGEISSAIINQVEIRRSNIGIASKDKSTAIVSNVEISDCNIGFAVYEKKPEYGPAEINIESLKAKGIKRDYLVEEGSRMTVDKVSIRPNEKDAYALLYEKE